MNRSSSSCSSPLRSQCASSWREPPAPKTRRPGSGRAGHLQRLEARTRLRVAASRAKLHLIGPRSAALSGATRDGPTGRDDADERRFPLQVIGAGPAAHHPSAVHCYVGRAAEDLDFSGLDGVVPAQVSDGFGVGVGVAVAVAVGVAVGVGPLEERAITEF